MIPPNPTLYVKNIDWKIKKGLLKRALYSLFSRHGKVLEIVALRKDGLRGQAFIIMDSVQSATAALQAEQGFTFFGKDLVIEYAKNKSDRIAKRDGDYVPKAKRQKVQQQQQQQGAADGEEEAPPKEEEEEGPAVDEQQQQSSGQPSSSYSAPDDDTAGAPPSKILLAEELPADCNEMMLNMLFRQYGGYKEVRLPRPGLAFVEFDDEPQATLAKKALQGFQLTPQDRLKLTYGKV